MGHDPSPTASLPRGPVARKILAAVLCLMLWSPVLLMIYTGMRAPVPIRVSAVLLPLAVLALVLPKVGYRRRDTLFLLVPGWNIGFTRIVCQRLAGLPHVDWPVRDDQARGPSASA